MCETDDKDESSIGSSSPVDLPSVSKSKLFNPSVVGFKGDGNHRYRYGEVGRKRLLPVKEDLAEKANAPTQPPSETTEEDQLEAADVDEDLPRKRLRQSEATPANMGTHGMLTEPVSTYIGPKISATVFSVCFLQVIIIFPGILSSIIPLQNKL